MRSALPHGAPFVGALSLLLCSVVAPGRAAAQADTGAAAPIQRLYAALGQTEQHGSEPFARRSQELAPAVDQALSIPTILQSSVGLRYRALPADQKQQLVQAFRDFTIARYVSNFSGNGDTFTVVPGTRPSPYGSDRIVQTRLSSAGGAPTEVDYVMRQFPQGWQAVDVLLDGHISQVAVQRSDFGSTLSSGNATPLIESLKKKTQSFSGT
ncbi:ABC transporter substrate-binding protein [Lichenicoccus sp.]|uniref:ABC transporter substrate-binding protein n=1 Tax=Lichenicoccus sp. TaxID=2781899 RepID=UPI003D0D64BE